MAFEGYLTCNFTNQGANKGTSPRPKHTAKIPIIHYEHIVEAPRDVSTGKAQGKRHHRPLTILKEIDGSSPQFFAACCTNEVLTSVVLEFWQKDAKGADEQHYQITLSNAHVVKHRGFTGQADADNSSAATAKNAGSFDTKELEHISFSFDKIQVEHKLANTMAADSWGATNQSDA